MIAGSPRQGWKLLIHGGAGMIDRTSITPDQAVEIRAALDRALAEGAKILGNSGSALDAVEASAKMLEDDAHFNAGRGAVLTHDGRIELDAAIMEGNTRAAGAVAGVTGVRNPICLARAVMERSEHVFLSGAGADAFSRTQRLPQASPDYFEVPERRRQLEELKGGSASSVDTNLKYGTIGAVAVDRHGHVAAAASTGGLTGKRWGRIGDSSVVGAGIYADDRGCAVSATGTGEYFIRVGAAHEISARVRMLGEGAQQAADAVIAEIGRLGGAGGVIVVTPNGDSAYAFNSRSMYRGTATAARRQVALFGDD